MAKIRPSHFCCGCLSLLIGIEIICLSHLIWCIMSIATTSSSEPMYMMGVKITPMAQVFNAAWALLGIPFIIGAGVGMLYRIEFQLRMYFWYSLATFFLNVVWWLSFLFSGELCQTIVGQEVQRMGTAFVCGFTDTFVFFWMLIAILVNLYCVYIIWSAAEEAGRSSYPELMKYSNALKSHLLPLPTGGSKEEKKVLKFEEKGNRPAPVYGSAPAPPPPPIQYAQPAYTSYQQPIQSTSYQQPMMSMPVSQPVMYASMPVSQPMMYGPSPGTVGIDINRDGITDFNLARGATAGVDVNRDGITDYTVSNRGPPMTTMGPRMPIQSMPPMSMPQSTTLQPASGMPQSFFPAPMSQMPGWEPATPRVPIGTGIHDRVFGNSDV